MMLNLLTSLDRDKYDIYVISKPKGLLVDRVKELGFNYIPVSSLRRNISPLDILAFISLFLIFRKHKFDIVHTHSSKPGFLGRIAARKAGIKCVIHTVHGFPFHQHQPQIAIKFYLILEKIASRFCDKIVVVNEFERKEAEKKGIIPAHKMLTIYNGIDVQASAAERVYPRVKPCTLPHQNGDIKLSCRPSDCFENSFIVGTVARFTPAKNIVNLTKCAVAVCRKSSNISFLLVGDGELFEQCRKIVIDNGMQERIIMPGWQHNSQEWLDRMDVFLLYSLWEGLSLSILEAMASRLPIIASNIKGNIELVTRDNGMIIDVNDDKRLIETILSLPERNEELTCWSRNSLARVVKLFNRSDFVRRYEELYLSCLSDFKYGETL